VEGFAPRGLAPTFLRENSRNPSCCGVCRNMEETRDRCRSRYIPHLRQCRLTSAKSRSGANRRSSINIQQGVRLQRDSREPKSPYAALTLFMTPKGFCKFSAVLRGFAPVFRRSSLTRSCSRDFALRAISFQVISNRGRPGGCSLGPCDAVLLVIFRGECDLGYVWCMVSPETSS
jgi:hypothetical protein